MSPVAPIHLILSGIFNKWSEAISGSIKRMPALVAAETL